MAVMFLAAALAAFLPTSVAAVRDLNAPLLSSPLQKLKLDPKLSYGGLQPRQNAQCQSGWIPCDTDATQCHPSGSECCAPSYYYYPDSQQCCANGAGACPKADSCCGLECCKPGASCGGDGLCSLAGTAVGTARTTRTSTSTGTVRSTSTGTRTGSGTSSSAFCEETGGAKVRKRDGVRVMSFEYVARDVTVGGVTFCVDNRELLKNMCDGIKNQKDKKCASAEQMKLTYQKDASKAQSNRNKMCNGDDEVDCAKFNVECDDTTIKTGECNPYLNVFKDKKGTYVQDGKIKSTHFTLTCDEFPFANSAEGGDVSSGSRKCVPAWQQSYQGGRLSGLKYVNPDEEYGIEIVNWDCSKGAPKIESGCKSPSVYDQKEFGGGSRKRADVVVGNYRVDQKYLFFPDFTQPGVNSILMYLGDVDPGTYNYTLDIDGYLSDIFAVDRLGDVLYNGTIGFEPSTVQQNAVFTLNHSALGVGLWGQTGNTDVAVNYSVTSTAENAAVRREGDSGGAGLISLAGLTALMVVWVLTTGWGLY